MALNWSCTDAEKDLVAKIVMKAVEHGFPRGGARILAKDIIALHCNGCPLDLWKLRSAGPTAFMHDINGISGHLDRKTGTLRHGFIPLSKRS